jgi:hypothetical protein
VRCMLRSRIRENVGHPGSETKRVTGQRGPRAALSRGADAVGRGLWSSRLLVTLIPILKHEEESTILRASSPQNVSSYSFRSSSWVHQGAARPPCAPLSCTSRLPPHSVDTSVRARALHSSNNPASLTSRLGATIDVEQNHVRFMGDLILNLWDCGGQDAFMDSYLSTQRSTIFQHVGVLIYVFEVSAHDAAKDAAYYRDCLDALQKYSSEAVVFLLVHKMDLVAGGDRAALLERRSRELQAESGAVPITVFGTSIHDETLYKVRRSPTFRFTLVFSLFPSLSPPHPLTPSNPRVWTDKCRRGRGSCIPSSQTRPSYLSI